MGDSMEVAFIVILLIIWVIRQIFSGIKKEADKSAGEGKPSLTGQLKKAFDEWSEQLPSSEEPPAVNETTIEKQTGEINCPHCGIRLWPDAEQWQENQLSCPACREWIDLEELAYTAEREAETWSEKARSIQEPQSSERKTFDSKLSGEYGGEERLEKMRAPITEDKSITEQRLEDSRRPEKRQPAEKTEPAQDLKKQGEDYYRPSRERREVLEFLKRKENTRRAFLVMELLQPPVSMRTSKSIWQDPEEQ